MERIVVLGGGESGCGSAVLARVKGFDVFLSDRGSIAPKYKSLLEQWNIPYEEGTHTEEKILAADRIVKSPGIPDKAPMVQAAVKKGIPIISEIEFSAPYLTASTICITGSNGKTTTTTLTYEILKQAGVKVGLAGNIGESLALSVATNHYDWYVIELSSFQLDGCYTFRTDIGVLMNITPDHLDRYDYKLQNYIDSKFRILQNQRPEDRFIYCADDPLTIKNLPNHPLPMRVLPFSVKKEEGYAAVLHDGVICVSLDGKQVNVPAAEMKIKGIHNIYNAMAASLAALSAGVDPKSIEQTLRSFAGIEHRLEPCGTIDGVDYINDSKATNVDSVWYALESMTRPVVWIAGGTDKGNDYSQLYDLVKEKVKTLVCMGVDNSKLKTAFAGRIEHIVDTHSLDEAMTAARQYAQAGYLCGYADEAYMASLPTIPYIVDHEAQGHYVAFEVKGDSMNDGTEDSILEGDRLLCREIMPHLWSDSKLHIRKWDFVIVHTEGILVKRIIDHNVENHTITIHSLNSIYPDRIINLSEVKQIFNVIELQRPRRR